MKFQFQIDEFSRNKIEFGSTNKSQNTTNEFFIKGKQFS